jgi:hypothetical protein
MKKVEKIWRIKLQVTKDNIVTRIYTHEPTEIDIQKNADSMKNLYGEVIFERFWRIN